MNSSGEPGAKSAADSKIERRLRIASLLALVALALIVFSLLVPKPLPVIVAMSVAQGLGTLSLLVFLHVVGMDLWRTMGEKTSASKKVNPDEQRPA